MIDAVRAFLESFVAWWSGIWALLERSLRIDARQRSHHLFRLFAVLAVYAAVAISESTGRTFGAPGLRYFTQLAYLNIAFIALAGIGYFSSVITEEKEEDTLGLMLMAGISPLGILLGKAGGRLIQAALLLTVQFPFTWLAITLGGVTRNQIVHTYIALLAFLVFLANVALVCLVICRRTRDAAALTFFWQLMYFLLPVAAETRLHYGGSGWWLSFLSGLSKCSVTHELQQILMSGSQPSVFNWQVVSNLLGGLAAFGLARLLFSWSARDLSADTTPRGLITFRTSGRGRWLGTSRVRGNAFAWKDFHFTCGGWTVVIVKIVAHAGLFAFIAYQVADFDRKDYHWRDTAGIYFGIGIFLLLLDTAWTMGRVFHEEIKLQTWPTLVMLPRSLPELAYSKCLGVILSLLPVCACLSLVFLTGALDFNEIVLDNLDDTTVWVIYGMAFLSIHLTVLYSVLVKWGALPLAIATLIGLVFVWEQFVVLSWSPNYWEYRDEINLFAVGLIGASCAACHVLIGLRLRYLATQ